MRKDLYRQQDKLFIIIQEIPEDKINNKKGEPNLDLLKTWRDWKEADHVLRLSHSYLLCETIQDLDFKEIKEEL